MYGVRRSASKRAGGGRGEAFEDLGVIEATERVGESTLDMVVVVVERGSGGTVTVARVRVQCWPLLSSSNQQCLLLSAAHLQLLLLHEVNSELVSSQQTVSAAKSSQQHGTQSSRSDLQSQSQSLSASTLVSSISKNMGRLSQTPLCSECASGPIFAISHVVGLCLPPILQSAHK
jgi:hypothetical protein